jgi:hypothetical protein
VTAPAPPAGDWAGVLAAHAAAAEEFAARAAAVPAERWREPRAPGKWSPAQETHHIVLAYEVLLRELRGGRGMRLRLSSWQRLLLRWLVMPRLLRTGRFPRGVGAPRELRPSERTAEQGALVGRLRRHATEFASVMARTEETTPGRKLTHPFFGSLSLAETVRMCEVHVRHHAAHLPPV